MTPLDALVLLAHAGIFKGIPRLPEGIRGIIRPEKFDAITGLKGKILTFRTVDGLDLRGYWYPSPGRSGKTVILGHGFVGSAGIMLPLVQQLHRFGYNAFAFDFRAHGDSAGKRSSLGFHEGKDIAAALRCIQKKFPDSSRTLVYLGHSMGASAYLMMPQSLEDYPQELDNIERSLQGAVLDSAYQAINPIEDPYVKKIYGLDKPGKTPSPGMRMLQRKLKGYIDQLARGFTAQSQAMMSLPSGLHELFPAEIYSRSSLRDKPLLLLHGKQDTRTEFAQGQAIAETLWNALGEDPNDSRIRFVPLDAHHLRKRWKPAGQEQAYRSVLRDEAQYLPALKQFLEEVDA